MPSKINQELVRAFNINLCHNEVAITNLTVQNVRRGLYKKDYIVISFDKSMDAGQCMKYLHNMKERIVETFCRSESTAGMSFDTSFFPFKFNKKQLDKDSRRGYRFLVPIDQGVIFNLKCLLANGVAKDIAEDIGKNFGVEYAAEHTDHISFDRECYLYCRRFNDWKLKVRFINLLSSKITGYGNAPMDYLEIIDNRVYIKKSIFDNVEFIKNIVKDKASLICRDFEVPSSEDEVVESLKFPIIDLLYEIGIPVDFIFHTSYTGSGENSVLVPAAMKVISNIEYYDFLSKEEVDYINNMFGMVVLNNIEDCTSPKHLPVSGNRGVYGIDFYDKDISYCVLNKIMESSVINKDHELAIDPELRLQALSPTQSTFNSPTHAGPSGIRTPPNQRKKDTDSGYDSNSPPKPKDSVAHSPSGVPRSLFEQPQAQRSPTRSQDGVLKDSPRRESEKKQVLRNHVNPDGPSKGFSPSPQLNSIAVSQRTGKCVGAAQNVQAGTSVWGQPMNRWSSPAPSAEPSLWQPSRPSSWKGANESGSAWTSQPIGYWSSPAPSAELRQQSKVSSSGPSSSRGANPVGANPWAQPIGYWSSQSSNVITPSIYYGIPRRPILLTTENDPKSSSPEFSARSPGVEDVKSICGVEPEKQQVTDKSDRESSDECSEAKSQESESSKKHWGGFQSKIKNLLLSPSKPKQHDASFKRCNVRRDTTRSIPASSVTEKPLVSKPFFSFPSRIRAKNNSPSKETSPVHSTINGSIPELSSQGVVDELNVPENRSSKISAKSGSGSQQNLSIGDKLGNMLSKLSSSIQNLFTNPASPTHKGVPGGLNQHQKEELYKVLSSEMKEKLDSGSLLLGYEKLLYLLYVDKRELRLLLSDPKAKEQVCSVLSPEKMEQVQSDSTEEILCLLHKLFSNQEISDGFLISSKVDSPKSEQLFAGEKKGVFVSGCN